MKSDLVFYLAIVLIVAAIVIFVYDMLKGKFALVNIICVVFLIIGAGGLYLQYFGIKVESVDDYIAGLRATSPTVMSTETNEMSDYTGADQTTGKDTSSSVQPSVGTDQSTTGVTNGDQSNASSTSDVSGDAGTATDTDNDSVINQENGQDNHFSQYYSNGQIQVEPGTYTNDDGSTTTVTKNADGTYTLKTEWADGGYQTMTY